MKGKYYFSRTGGKRADRQKRSKRKRSGGVGPIFWDRGRREKPFHSVSLGQRRNIVLN